MWIKWFPYDIHYYNTRLANYKSYLSTKPPCHVRNQSIAEGILRKTSQNVVSNTLIGKYLKSEFSKLLVKRPDYTLKAFIKNATGKWTNTTWCIEDNILKITRMCFHNYNIQDKLLYLYLTTPNGETIVQPDYWWILFLLYFALKQFLSNRSQY